MNRPARYRRVIARGDPFVWDFVYKAGPDATSRVPVDLTGATARLTIRDGATDAVLATIASGGGGISLTAGGQTGRIRCEVAGAVTATFPLIDEVPPRAIKTGTHKYDFVLSGPTIPLPETKTLGEFVVWERQSRPL